MKGHPLVLSVCDSKGNGNVANACARAAVSNGTVADIGGFNFVGTPMEIMNAGKLPMIGRTPGFDPKEYSFPTVFPYFGVGLTGMSAAVYAAVKFEHATKIALITSPPANALYFPTGIAEAKMLGATITGTISAMPGSDLTSAVLKAKQNGTQAIAAITPIVDQVIVAARQNGITLPIVSSLQPAQIKSVGSAGEGVKSIEPFQLPTASEPGLEQMQKEFNQYAPGIPQTVFTLPAWLAVHMFADVANKLPSVHSRERARGLPEPDQPVRLRPDPAVHDECEVQGPWRCIPVAVQPVSLPSAGQERAARAAEWRSAVQSVRRLDPGADLR